MLPGKMKMKCHWMFSSRFKFFLSGKVMRLFSRFSCFAFKTILFFSFLNAMMKKDDRNLKIKCTKKLFLAILAVVNADDLVNKCENSWMTFHGSEITFFTMGIMICVNKQIRALRDFHTCEKADVKRFSMLRHLVHMFRAAHASGKTSNDFRFSLMDTFLCSVIASAVECINWRFFLLFQTFSTSRMSDRLGRAYLSGAIGMQCTARPSNL